MPRDQAVKPSAEPAEDPLLSDLTPPQRQAVQATEGPLLILAAAGSGKTRVITRRIAYLISLGIPSWQILALTFTNKAAGEMRERVERLLTGAAGGDGAGERVPPPGGRGLTITTFHALCARLLRRFAPLMEGRTPRGGGGWSLKADYSIYDSEDQASLMKRVLSELDLSTTNWPPRSVLAHISAAKNELKDSAAYGREAGDFHSRSVAKIFAAYEKALRAANAVDFDDLLLLTVRLLKESDEARAEVQGRWRYLMIDEYQDTNHAQFVLSTLLCAPPPPDAPGGREAGRGANVCVVGDPDQSIYGWRGADIANILEFEEQYPGARVIALGQNFRSTAPILAVADALIRHNQRRKHKDLFTTRTGGERPTAVLCRDEHHEAQLVVGWLKSHHAPAPQEASGDATPNTGRTADGAGGALAWKDMAVFYRNNFLSRVMEDALRASGIPYVIARGTAFYQREEVKDALAYLRLIANPADEVSLRRIVNKPARKIGGSSLEKIDKHARRTGLTLLGAMSDAASVPELSAAAAGAVERFVAMIDAWSVGGSFMGNQSPCSLPELVGRVLSESGLEKHYGASKLKDEAEAERLANLEELVSSARDFEESYDAASDPAMNAPLGPDAPLPGGGEREAPDPPDAPPLPAMLRAYLESVSLVADADKVDPASGAVTLMTLHAAKGLEFSAVSIIGLEEGLLPGARALESEAMLEEERRLFFVGITRAMDRLMITSSKYRTARGLRERTIPSRFLGELPPKQVALSDQSEALDDLDSGDAPWGAGGGAARLRAHNARGSARSGATPSRELADSPFPVGAQVRHPQFGVGLVRAVHGVGANRRAVIQFRQAGTKTLVLQYARLERLS